MTSTATTGTCPVCQGTLRKLAEFERGVVWATSVYGYDKATHTVPCNNCGGQYMSGKPTGIVRLRTDTFEPCHHEYSHQSLGRCWHGYTCIHCGDQYDIDSGD